MNQKLVYLGMLTAFCVVLSYIEALIPFIFGVPGMKLGLANLGIVLCMYLFGKKEALLINIMRVLIVGFLFSNLSSVLYSISGAVFSFLMMCFMIKCQKFGITGVSMAGSVFHMTGQCLVAFFVMKSIGVFYYFPVLMIGAVITGLLIGQGAGILYKRLKPITKKIDERH